MPTAAKQQGAQSRAHLGPPDTMEVRRDGDLDITFSGWVLGDGDKGTTQVVVYGTVGGNLITESRRSAFGRPSGVHRAAVHKTPDEALAWLRADNGGSLGEASKLAWMEACEAWPELKGCATERVS
jgi:hypothetical protein